MVQVMDSIASLLHDHGLDRATGDIRETYDHLYQTYIALIKFKELKSEILQGFRELGNAIVVTHLLEDHMRLQHTLSRNLIRDIAGDDPNSCYMLNLADMEAKLSELNPMADYKGYMADLSAALHSYEGPTLMKDMIQGMRESARIVEGTTTSVLLFYRLWAALDFVCCVPEVSGERTIREIFGDGLFLAGCSFLHATGQVHKFRNESHTLQLANITHGAQEEMGKILVAAQQSSILNEQWLETMEKY
jgi:hypothetical protein